MSGTHPMHGMRDLGVGTLRAAYADGSLTPAALFSELRERSASLAAHNVFITLFDEETLRPWLAALAAKDPATHPLWAIPFALKDNIDIAGIPTTAACEAFAYTPDAHATVVARLLDAGAIPLGKTNLDQFATGLNGTRSPWGACRNSHDPDFISGGSSSGSAVAVALGLASFSLGTDTAGSGRVPAGFNDLVGLKPTCGLIPTTGVVPACRSLDCVSVFALDATDANAVLAAVEGVDGHDGYARANPAFNTAARHGRRDGPLRLAVPDGAGLAFFGDDAYEAAWRQTLATFADDAVELVEIDYAPFDEIARLLYEGPWVAERHVATEPLILERPEAMFPVVRDIIADGAMPLARDYFRAEYRLRDLAPACLAVLDEVDALLTPTAGRLFTIEEMLAEPLRRNSALGRYTNFVNLLDLAAVALPAGFTPAGLPFGVTLIGRAFADRALLSIASRFETTLANDLAARVRPDTMCTSPELAAVGDARRVELLVCGAHMSGMALEPELSGRGARLIGGVRTAPCYRLYALAGEGSARPGLRYVGRGGDVSAASGKAGEGSAEGDAGSGPAGPGASIEAELWSVPSEALGDFVAGIPAPLGIGRVTLESGREVTGFICEERGFAGAMDITGYGGWRGWRERG